jgi:hypothetical protein
MSSPMLCLTVMQFLGICCLTAAAAVEGSEGGKTFLAGGSHRDDARAFMERVLSAEYSLHPVLSLSPPNLRTPSSTDAPQGESHGGGDFWSVCWEQRVCLLRPLSPPPSQEKDVVDMLGRLEHVMSSVSGSWLLEELSVSKLNRCRVDTSRLPSAAAGLPSGCRWGDGSILPPSYFDGADGQASLISIRGSVSVQDDIVVGDTMSKTVAEDELLTYLRGRRNIHRTRSFVGEGAHILGSEWRSFADDTNQTLFIRDADGRTPELFDLAGGAQMLFEDPRKYLAAADNEVESLTTKKKQHLLFNRSGGVEAGVSLYYTPPTCNSTVPPHIDVMDVFAIQVVGRKRWSVAAPHTKYVLPSRAVQLPLSREHFASTRGATRRAEVEGPKMRATIDLLPGDVLYVPRGVIHNTSTIIPPPAAPGVSPSTEEDIGEGPSLHISLGIETSPAFILSDFVMRSAAIQRNTQSDDTTTCTTNSGDDCARPHPATRATEPPSSLLRRCIAQRVWSGVPSHVRSFAKQCTSRALLFHLTNRVPLLRRGFVVPVAAVTTDAAGRAAGEEGRRGRLLRFLEEILNNGFVATREYLVPAGEHERAGERVPARIIMAAKAKWSRVVQDALGSVTALRGSSDIWWSDEDAVAFDMDTVIGILTSVILDNIVSLLSSIRVEEGRKRSACACCDLSAAATTSTIEGASPSSLPLEKHIEDDLLPAFFSALAEELVLWAFPIIHSSPPPSVPSSLVDLWAGWLDQVMQRSHEERLAFAEWTWVNDVLLR